MNKFSHLARGEESCGGKGRKIYPDGFDGSLRFFSLSPSFGLLGVGWREGWLREGEETVKYSV